MQTELTVAQADRLIREMVPAWPAEQVALDAAAGRVLRQNVLAERDLPPYDRATMDGIALVWRSWSSGQGEFPLEGMQSAGQAPGALSSAGVAWRIATGAPVPEGADTVVPVERLSETNGAVRIDDDYRPKRGQFIHRQGSDRRAGALLLKEGRRIGGVEMALLSANGVAQPARRPRSPHRAGVHRRRTRWPGLPPRKLAGALQQRPPPCQLCSSATASERLSPRMRPTTPTCSRIASARRCPTATR